MNFDPHTLKVHRALAVVTAMKILHPAGFTVKNDSYRNLFESMDERRGRYSLLLEIEVWWPLRYPTGESVILKFHTEEDARPRRWRWFSALDEVLLQVREFVAQSEEGLP